MKTDIKELSASGAPKSDKMAALKTMIFGKRSIKTYNGEKLRVISRDGEPPRSLAPKPTSRVITIVLLTFLALYFLVPIWWLIVASTKNNNDLVNTFGLWFSHNSIGENWVSLQHWTQGIFGRWVLNSLIYSTVSGAIGTLISVAAGYSLARFDYPGKKVILVFIMSGLLMPVVLLTIPLYLMMHSIGLSNTMLSIIIPSCVSPFGVFLGNVYAQSSIPQELLEAARIDGAGELRIFFTMVLRLLAPAMVTIFLFIYVATWNNFLLPLMMVSSREIMPVTQGLYGMITYFKPDKGAVMLGSLLGVLPLIVLFLGLQKYWRAGLAAGSVKG